MGKRRIAFGEGVMDGSIELRLWTWNRNTVGDRSGRGSGGVVDH